MQSSSGGSGAEGNTLSIIEAAIPVPSKWAVELFACMSRFEFALKECDYIVGEEGRNAGVGWADFARVAAANGAFDKLQNSSETRVLIEAPPRKQLRSGTSFVWSDPPQVKNMQQFTEALRQVRNNLFHGGKGGDDPRDEELCRAATAALIFLVGVDPRVRDAFMGLY